MPSGSDQSSRTTHATRSPDGADVTDHANPTPGRPRHSAKLVAGVLALALVGGFLALRPDGADVDGPTITRRDADTTERAGTPDVSTLPAPDRPVAAGPGTDPQDALEGFVAAEVATELETAWTWLSPGSHEVWTTPGVWVASHADALGQVTGVRIDAIEIGPDDATASGELSRVPTLDPVAGLVPARSTFVVELVRTDAGWTVDARTLDLRPVLPGDASASAAARQFLEDARACRAPALPLVGRASMLASFCDLDGEFRLGPVTPLDDVLIVQPFIAAYGGEVTGWARTVAITGAVDATLVLGPFGDGWVPIGLASGR